jgi:hypothetical protein
MADSGIPAEKGPSILYHRGKGEEGLPDRWPDDRRMRKPSLPIK